MTTVYDNAQKMKFSIKDIFSKCDQTRSFLWIRSHLLEKSLMENIIFCVVYIELHKGHFTLDFTSVIYVLSTCF